MFTLSNDLRRQFLNRLKVREVHLAAQVRKKVCLRQTIHHRPFHFGQVQFDARVTQSFLNGF